MIALEYENIVLHPLREQDADALFAIIDRNRNNFRQWLSWIDDTKEVSDTKKYIADAIEQTRKGTGLYFTVRYKNIIVGVIAFIFIHKRNRKAHIGYWLDEKYQGKGIMTKACNLLIDYGFKEMRFNRVELGCAVGNSKSCAIPKRLGFTKEGLIRDSEWLHDHFVDHEFYGLLAREWKASKNNA